MIKMGKRKKFKAPEMPYWYWLDRDGCWDCKDRHGCNKCKKVREYRKKYFSKKEKGNNG